MSKSKILFQMTGSIAAFKACGLVSKLVQAGHEVQVVASPSALQFIGAATLEGLTGKAVISDLWEKGHAMDHIHLMRWADLVIVAPASAHFINRIAQGVGDDLLTTMFLAHDFKKPYLLAPAMNTSMYLHPATQASLKTLRSWGIQVLEAASGVLACGEVGYGRLLEPEELMRDVEKALHMPSDKHQQSPNLASREASKVLVTIGGTSEPVDDVRSITNMSTGRTGAEIASTLSQLGFSVTVLASRTASPVTGVEKVLPFTCFTNLKDLLHRELSQNSYSAIVHAAAVSDYRVSQISLDGKKVDSRKKIPSGTKLTVEMTANEKLVDHLREWSQNKDIQVIAFKLTSQAKSHEREEAVKNLFAHSQANYVVLNDLSEIDKTQHRFQIFDSKLKALASGQTRQELASQVAQLAGKDLL